jgi:hypothetical protein
VSQSVEGEFREAVWYERPGKLRSELTGELHDLGALKAGHIRVAKGEDYFLAWQPGRRFCYLGLDEDGSAAARQKPDAQIVGFPGSLDLSAARIDGEGIIAGRPALKVIIDPAIPHRLVWIDSMYGVVLAYENDRETSAMRARLRSLQRGPERRSSNWIQVQSFLVGNELVSPRLIRGPAQPRITARHPLARAGDRGARGRY